MDCRAVISALASELAGLSARLTQLQEVPLIPADPAIPLSGEELLRAMVAIQDLDRLAQESGAVAAFAQSVAGSVAADSGWRSQDALAIVPLRSVADRLRTQLSQVLPS